MYSHTQRHTQSQRLLAPTAICCYDASLGVARRPLRQDGSVSQKIMTKSIKALGGKGAPETSAKSTARRCVPKRAQTRADSLLTIPSLRLSRQPRAVPPGARESRKTRVTLDLDAAAAPRPSHVTSEDPQPALAAANRVPRAGHQNTKNKRWAAARPSPAAWRAAPSTRRRPSRPAAI